MRSFLRRTTNAIARNAPLFISLSKNTTLAGHALFMKSTLTGGKVRIFSDNAAVAGSLHDRPSQLQQHFVIAVPGDQRQAKRHPVQFRERQ